MLPIKRFVEIGTPFHGLVVDGTLTLPNSATMAWPTDASPFTQVLRNSVGAANAPTRTTEQQTADTAAGRQWLDYALRNGSRMIGRVISSYQWILYADPAGTVWLIENRFINSNTQFRPRLYVAGVFGRVTYGGTPQDLTCDRLIYSADITPTDDETLAADNYYIGTMLQNESGSKVLYKGLRVIKGDTYAQRYGWTQYATQEVNAGRRMSDLYEITISGTGSLEAGHIGEGISASASLVADFSTLYTDSSVSVTEISEQDIVGECAGPFGSETFQVTVGGSAQGATFSGSNNLTDSFTAKLDAYYDDLGAIQYVEREFSEVQTYTASASASATGDIVPPNVTWCYLFSGTATDYDELTTSAGNAGTTVTGSWDRTRVRSGDYDDCITGPTSTYGTECVAAPTVPLTLSSEIENGTPEAAEVYVATIAPHGLVLIAQGYDDSGTKRYTRTVVAPDGNTLAIDPTDAPLTYSKMNPDGIAWHPVTGQIVWYPGQKVGFV